MVRFTNSPYAFGDLALQRQLSQHDSADTELSIHTPASTGDLAPIAAPARRELGSYSFVRRLVCHLAESLPFPQSSLRSNSMPSSSRRNRLISGLERSKQIFTFIPCENETWAMLISGQMPCSINPIE